MLTWKL